MDVKMCLYFIAVIIFHSTQQAISAIPEYFVEEHCSQTLALNHGNAESVRLRLTKSAKYLDGMRCAMRIQAPEGKRLVVRIENLDVRGSQEALCQGGDYLQFFDGPTESSIIHPDLPATVCQKPSVDYILTSGRFFVMRFVSNTDLNSGSGMKLVITAFSDAPCAQDEFQCKITSHCIRRSLQCDQQPSCPDATDESMPECLSTGAIVGISVACVVVVLAAVISVVVCCIVRERRKRARIIKRAMEHQVKHQTYAGSLWVQSQHSGVHPSEVDPILNGHIDLSKIDPIWDGQIESSKIDPIWDGQIESSKIDLLWDGREDSRASRIASVRDRNVNLEKILQKWDMHKGPSTIDPIWNTGLSLWENTENERKIKEEYDINRKGSKIVGDDTENSEETNDSGPIEGQMKKVPSGFWEIDLSELGIDLCMNSIPSTTVL